MTLANWVMGVLLTGAVALTLICAIGVAVMRDACQRMQFCTPVASISAVLITIAVWLGDPSWQARLKMLCIATVLFWTNAILSHATARAIRLRQMNQLEPMPKEKIPIVNEK
jgi:multisubunit Na+/H+ antiporter MnhG subunit